MKIVGIMSSPSHDGNTARLVREALRSAAEQGAEVDELFLADHRIEFCRGCFDCMAHGQCPIGDDVEALRQRIYDSDGIVLGSPTYGLEVNAIMKNFSDRVGMYNVYTSRLAGKYVVGISTAGGIGANRVAKKLTTFADGFWGRGYASGHLGVIRGWQRVEEVPHALAKARSLGTKLARDIEEQRRYPYQNLPDRLVKRLFVRRFIRQNVLGNKDGTMKAVYDHLTAHGLLDPGDDGHDSLASVLALTDRATSRLRPVLSAVLSH